MSSKTIPFRTAYGERETYYSPSGDEIEPIYGYEINKYGQKELVKTGETNTYAKIQECLEETKIENILKRYAAGDMTVFRPEGMYADVSEAPKSLLEARQQIQKLENLWSSLDQEIKDKYGNSLDEFMTKSGSESWLIDMGMIEKKPVETKKEKPVETKESEVTEA